MTIPTATGRRPATGLLWALRCWRPRGRCWAAALGALTALGTLGGLLLATTVGLFGFVESTGAALWWESLWVEVGAIVVLAALAALAARRRD